jgi:hypothetical protein
VAPRSVCARALDERRLAVSRSREISQERDQYLDEIRTLREEHERTVESLTSRQEKETEGLRRQISSLKNRAHSAETEAKRLDQELATLMEETRGWHSIRNERDELLAQVANLRVDCKRLEELLGDAEADRDDHMQLAIAAKAALSTQEEQTRAALKRAETAEEEAVAAREAWKSEVEELRSKAAERLALAREEWEERHLRKVEEVEVGMRAALDQEMGRLKKRVAELVEERDRALADAKDAKRRLAGQVEFCRDLQGKVSGLEARVEEVEQGRLEDRSRWEEEVAAVRADRDAVADRFDALMDVKIVLQAEIAQYRRILEAEEVRAGLPTPARELGRKMDAAHASPGAMEDASSLRAKARRIQTAIDEAAASRPAARAAKREREESDDEDGAIDDNDPGFAMNGGPDDDDNDNNNNGADEKPVRVTRSSVKASPAKRVTRSQGPAEVVTSSAAGVHDLGMRIDLKSDCVVLWNTGKEDISLGGWTLISAEGGQHYEFPEDTTLGPKEHLFVWSGPNSRRHAAEFPSSLVWGDRFVWNDRGDSARLADAQGDIALIVEASPHDDPINFQSLRGSHPPRGETCVVM